MIDNGWIGSRMSPNNLANNRAYLDQSWVGFATFDLAEINMRLRTRLAVVFSIHLRLMAGRRTGLRPRAS